MGATTIQWTDATWNPVTGCTKVSQGCKHCYAERIFARPYPGRKFTDVRTHPERLDQPLGWRKPRRVFVNSMSDLFHEGVADEFIDQVFAAMALAPQHVFQILTKRPERALAYLVGRSRSVKYWEAGARGLGYTFLYQDFSLVRFPLPNVWLGVSVEDQATADERIPLLLQTPAAVRFVSYEPALGPVDFTEIPRVDPNHPHPHFYDMADLDWVIVGGESGPKARPFDVAWARSTIAQCKEAGVPCFVKQLGANIRDRNDAGFAAEEETWAEGPDAGKPTNPRAWPTPYGEVEHDVNGYREEYQGAPVRVRIRDRTGGDPSEWPEDLRVREWPEVA